MVVGGAGLVRIGLLMEYLTLRPLLLPLKTLLHPLLLSFLPLQETLARTATLPLTATLLPPLTLRENLPPLLLPPLILILSDLLLPPLTLILLRLLRDLLNLR